MLSLSPLKSPLALELRYIRDMYMSQTSFVFSFLLQTHATYKCSTWNVLNLVYFWKTFLHLNQKKPAKNLDLLSIFHLFPCYWPEERESNMKTLSVTLKSQYHQRLELSNIRLSSCIIEGGEYIWSLQILNVRGEVNKGPWNTNHMSSKKVTCWEAFIIPLSSKYPTCLSSRHSAHTKL